MLPSSTGSGSGSGRKPTPRSSKKKAKERKKHRKLSHIENEYFFNTFTDRVDIHDPDTRERLNIGHYTSPPSMQNSEYLPSGSQFGVTHEGVHAPGPPRAFDFTMPSDSAVPPVHSSNSSYQWYLSPYAIPTPDLALPGPNHSTQNYTRNQFSFTREHIQPITQLRRSESYLAVENQVPNLDRSPVPPTRFLHHESNLLDPHSEPLSADGTLTAYENFSPATRYPYSFPLDESRLEEDFNTALASTQSTSSYYFMPHSDSQNTSRESLNLANTVASGTALRHNLQGSDDSESLNGFGREI